MLLSVFCFYTMLQSKNLYLLFYTVAGILLLMLTLIIFLKHIEIMRAMW